MYPIHMFTATLDFQISLRIFSRGDTSFQVTDHFETKAPNDPKMTLNTKTSKVPVQNLDSLTHGLIFKIAIFGHEIWSSAKDPEIAHILSFYPTCLN